MCGFSSEVAALVAEKGFYSLKAPVCRISLPDCPAPVSWKLEQVFYPKASTLAAAALTLLKKDSCGLQSIDRIDGFKGPY